MFHKGTRVNTPKGFARVIEHHIVDNKLASYSVEMENGAARSHFPAKDISLSKESDALIKKYLATATDTNTNQDNEITKRTCPACDGAGVFENRVETSTSYTVIREACFLCEGNSVVAAAVYAQYARMISKLV